MEKGITKALLRDEYIEAYVKSFSISDSADSIMEVNLSLLLTDNTQVELANLVNGNTGRIAIIRL